MIPQSWSGHGSINKCVTQFLCSWMISRALVDYTNIGRRDIIASTTSFCHTSMVSHPGSDDYLHIRKFIHEGLLSSSLKKQRNGKVSLNNVVLGIDYKLTINMLMKQLYIAVQYFYITNQLILGKISRAIYTFAIRTFLLTTLMDINPLHTTVFIVV